MAVQGLPAGHREMAERTLTALWAASDEGRLPIVCDASSCTHGLTQLATALAEEDRARYAALRFVDSVTFTAEHLLPALPEPRRLGSLALHPTCSTVHLGGVDDLRTVAAAVADTVTVPDSWGAAPSPATGDCCIPRSPPAPPRPRPPRSTSATTTRTPPATAPARWA
ncbi:hypothetical protein NKG94_04395 [Micromonospora sp. M12]